MKNLNTKAKNTWCPFCGNFGVLASFKKAIEKENLKNIVITAGIGCHGKIVDYVNVNSYCSLHGRSVCLAEGIKLGNPKLKVVAFTGDGDSLDEGIAHLIHAAKRNSDITVILQNNRLFALTTGQFTAASPKGFKGRSTPKGSPEKPLNPLDLMHVSGASFIARSYSGNMKHLEKIIKEAIEHKGFSFVEVLEPCVSFFNTTEFYNKNIYEMDKEDISKIKEWDYSVEDCKIPIGVFYREARDVFNKVLYKAKKEKIEKVLEKFL